MGYSESIATLERMLPLLKDLAEGRECMWETKGSPSYLAYKIREALYIAKENKANYPGLAAAAEAFTIQVIRDGSKRVQAVRAKNTPETSTLASANRITSIVTGLESAGPPVPTAGPQSSQSIIDAWNKTQPRTEPINFPQANLPDIELDRLYTWCQAHVPRLMMLVSGASLTLGPVEPEVEEYAYHPKGMFPSNWKPFKLERRPDAGSEDLPEGK